MKVVRISNIDDKRICIFRSLKGKDYLKKGIFIAEGEKVAGYLLKSNIALVSVLTTNRWLKEISSKLKKSKKTKVKVYLLDKKEIDKVIGYKLHQGIMIAAKIPRATTINKVVKLSSGPHLFVAFDSIRDAENIGLIIRNCVAFGVDALIMDKKSSNPYLRRAVRVSMGAIFNLPVVMVEDVAVALRMLRKRFKVSVVAASPQGKFSGVDKLVFSRNMCLVLGNEAYGISKNILQLADNVVKINIAFESLNVANASAIILHHLAVLRQR